jgi:dTDP-4-dehydrorhamnose 3,5-epimerase
MSDLNKVSYNETMINGLEIIERTKFIDERGSFERLFSEKFYSPINDGFKIVDINLSKTMLKGTVRGMHYQAGASAETKLVTCVSGSLIDAVIDMRPDSSTYLKIFSIKLEAEDSLTIKIPKGCAHGFQSQEDDTHLLYFVDNYYSSTDQRGINPLSDELINTWPLEVSLVSEQDSKWPKMFNIIK